MNKNIENIQKNIDVMHFSTIPDGTLHYHNYIEMELIEDGNISQIINGQQFSLSKHSVSILRPYLDSQSLIAQGTTIFDHNVVFEPNKDYNVKCGAMHVVNGTNNGKVYLFLSIDGNIIAEQFLNDDFSCISMGFFSKYSTKNIRISQNDDDNTDFSKSKILCSDDVFSPFDTASNTLLGLPDSFILDQNDLSFHEYNKSTENTLGSFVYNCNINIETIGYRIIILKLIGKEKEINFLITTDKVFIMQMMPKNEFKIYKLCINSNLVSLDTRKKLLSFNNPLCINLSDEAYENMKHAFDLLIHFYNKNNSSDKVVLDLVEVLFRLFFDENLPSNSTDSFKEKVLMFFVDKDRFLDDISLEDFAKYLGYDAGYASRLCIKTTGYSFVKYKIYLRLQYAKHLILSTNIPIIEIAMKCGFNSQSVFNRFFKADTGYSPTQYRTLHSEKK